jgi:hypothetical protein
MQFSFAASLAHASWAPGWTCCSHGGCLGRKFSGLRAGDSGVEVGEVELASSTSLAVPVSPDLLESSLRSD